MLLVGIWVGSAFAPGAVERHLVASAAEWPLPVGFALDESRRLVLAFHRDDAEAPAFFLEGPAGTPPRLVLYGPHYLRGVELRPLLDLPVDLSEGYFQALLEGFLRHQIETGGTLGPELRSRAQATMVDVPPAHRLEAYVDAQASFGAHLLSIVNELDRSELRRRAGGRSLCSHVGGPLPLFSLWERALGESPFPGAYVARGPHSEELVRFSRSTLTAADKRFLLERVLDAPWKGPAATDLGPRYCRGAGVAPGA
jgi:hypothetical protein